MFICSSSIDASISLKRYICCFRTNTFIPNKEHEHEHQTCSTTASVVDTVKATGKIVWEGNSRVASILSKTFCLDFKCQNMSTFLTPILEKNYPEVAFKLQK